MRQNTLIALAAVALPLAIAAILLPAPGGVAVKPAPVGPVFPALKDWIGSAAKLTVVGADGTAILEHKRATGAAKPGAGWTLADKGGYPVQEATIKPVLAGLVALHSTEAKTALPQLYSRLDLQDPGKGAESHSLELSGAAAGQSVKLIVGKRKDDPLGAGNDGVYIRRPGEAQSWLAQPAFSLPDAELDWIDRKILDLDPDKIKSLTLTPAAGPALAFTRDKAGDKLAVIDLPKDVKLKTDDPAGVIADEFRYLDLQDVRPAAQLTAKPAGSVQLATFDGLDAALTLVQQDGATWATVAAAGSGAAAKPAGEIAGRTRGWAYKLSEDQTKALETRLADLVEAPAAKPGDEAKPPPKRGAAKPAAHKAAPVKPVAVKPVATTPAAATPSK